MRKLSIKCDAEKRKKSIRRMDAYDKKQYIDRIPAYFGVEARYLLAERGIGFLEYFESPENNFHHQLMNFKWRMENIEDDFLAKKEVVIFPDFQNTTTAGLFNESAIVWSDKETPRVAHFIHTIEELRKVDIPDLDKELGGRKKRYIQRMQDIAKDYQVEVNGEPIPIIVGMGWQETIMTGALDILGENLLVWMMEYPEDMKRFLEILTIASIHYEKEMMVLTAEKRNGAGAVADGGEMLSAAQFEEFMVPCYLKFYNAFEGNYRGLHMCGQITHLLKTLKDKLKITMLNGFGFSTDPKKIAETVGDSFFYSGGLNPITLWKGSDIEVKTQVERYVQILGPYRTYMIGDGYNVVPGTSAERMNSIVRHLDEIGIP